MTASPQIAMASPQNLADILTCIAGLPDADLDVASTARTRAMEARLETMPAELLTWMATWQGKVPPRVNHPRIILFAADHGVSKGAAPAMKQVERIIGGTAPVCGQADVNDADLRLYELDLSTPTADFTEASAMGEGECTAAIVYGMMAVEMGLDIVALGAVSGGTHLAAAALAAVLGHGNLAAAWLDTPDNPLLNAAKAQHQTASNAPLELLRRAGGREIAAMLGTIVAARMAHMPVIIEGPGGLMAAALLHRLNDRAVQHCLFVGGPSDQVAHKLAAELGMIAITDETGDTEPGMMASAVIPLLRDAIA